MMSYKFYPRGTKCNKIGFDWQVPAKYLGVEIQVTEL